MALPIMMTTIGLPVPKLPVAGSAYVENGSPLGTTGFAACRRVVISPSMRPRWLLNHGPRYGYAEVSPGKATTLTCKTPATKSP